MIWAAILRSRPVRWLGLALAALLAGLGIHAAGRREGRKEASERALERDVDNAKDIEERADEALRRLDGDTRPVDERLRARGHLRD